MWVFCAPSLALFLALLVAQQAASRTSHAGDATASLARGCGGVGDVHVAVFWAALGERGTRAGVQALAETPGVTVLEVHSKRWPRDPAEFAACHRNFYANNHAEKVCWRNGAPRIAALHPAYIKIYIQINNKELINK